MASFITWGGDLAPRWEMHDLGVGRVIGNTWVPCFLTLSSPGPGVVAGGEDKCSGSTQLLPRPWEREQGLGPWPPQSPKLSLR